MNTSALPFDTAQIGVLRTFLERYPGLRVFGSFAQFHVVLDANAVVADLVQRVRYPKRCPTAIEELVRATVLIAHAPRWLEHELTRSAIPKVAIQYKVPVADLLTVWTEYRKLISWDDTLTAPPSKTAACCDPADLPYVWLAHKIGAWGIVSRDAHIRQLGGRRLHPHDFVLGTRNYARSAAASVGSRVGVAGAALIALALLVLLAKGIAAAFRALPPPGKAALIGMAAAVLGAPNCRARLRERSGDAAKVLASGASGVVEVVGSLLRFADEAERAANTHLEAVMALSVELPPPACPPAPPGRRRRRRVVRRSGASRSKAPARGEPSEGAS